MTDYRFAPAAPEEGIVYGACAPGGVSHPDRAAAAEEWIEAVHERGIERVCCLLTDRQLLWFDGLLAEYRAAFSEDAVLHAPIRDHHLADLPTLREDVLPFFRAADDAGEPVVVHCLAGIGRTGHVLAAWLVHARGYDVEDAIETVAETGRDPREAVRSGNATAAELRSLLAGVRSVD